MNINPINEDEQWKLLIFSLNEIRIKKNISCLKISELSGKAPNHVSRFFSCKYKPTLQTFLKIAKAIGVNFFFEDKESKTDLNLAIERAMEALGRRTDKL
ncbi:helix-turn-helix domain-containing protein [Flavobacterium psychrophilum]|uniref:Helix-turn-helix transcriptional regulator n=1 Tax=Flavobacterium psychrophilum TaxID=96345 RepID=A0A7U2NEA4_FLAPS|nr:helix-turn-helix transcriptional regulator [Flavobacterium psychrophilum]QRE03551.1 helix-turn-helix transcriptional regulator [Flavobacterium psychrophilum]